MTSRYDSFFDTYIGQYRLRDTFSVNKNLMLTEASVRSGWIDVIDSIFE